MLRRIFVVMAFLSVLFMGSLSVAQEAPKPAAPAAAQTIGGIIDRQLTSLEREFVSAAEAMPDKDFFWAPTTTEYKGSEFKNVRTFAQQIGHVASENLNIAAAILGEAAPATDNDGSNGPKSLKTKADYIAYLKKSFAEAHRAAASIDCNNATQQGTGEDKRPKLAQANELLWHSFDHYGQMVVYLRARGIVPPASRPR